MNKFLVKFDFQTLIDEDNLNEVTDNNDRIITDAIDSAVEEVAGYIRHRYDFDQVFRVVIPYANATEFVLGDRVYWSETAYSEDLAYTVGQLVSYNKNIYSAIGTTTPGAFNLSEWNLLAENDSFYTCIQDSSGNLPTNTNYFTAGDNRNPKIKQVTVDIVLYNIHSKVSPRSIPEVRRIRYDGFGNKNDSENAIRYLEKVQKGQITPDLPVIIPTLQNTERWSFGTSSSIKHSY
jgi:hypothetical protein